jgi:dephospho-CoA kinase
MLRVGLTGGIGSGKSEVSRRLAALGAVVLDADKAAREVVAPGTPGLAAVVETFGSCVLLPDGSLDRARLGEIVFADAEARGRLNAIVHPLVHERMRAAEAEAVAAAADGAADDGAADDGAVIVHDVPLLTEGGRSGDFDLVIVVDAPPDVQVERLARQRGMTAEDAIARMAAQATREQRLAVADIVIDNSGTLADLDSRVKEVWADLRVRALGRPAMPGPLRWHGAYARNAVISRSGMFWYAPAARRFDGKLRCYSTRNCHQTGMCAGRLGRGGGSAAGEALRNVRPPP